MGGFDIQIPVSARGALEQHVRIPPRSLGNSVDDSEVVVSKLIWKQLEDVAELQGPFSISSCLRQVRQHESDPQEDSLRPSHNLRNQLGQRPYGFRSLRRDDIHGILVYIRFGMFIDLE